MKMGRLAELAGDGESGEKSRTFVFQDEGHTLGNALRSIIAQYPDVQFCGYTVPHPAETKMHFRIQAKSGRAVDILRKGLEDLEKACEHTAKAFETAWQASR
ncbi:DNA-directed RNA polymerases I and III subunit RPAC2 isoform X1 [Neodiprion pinetum]|uniref:DNA-directed RNA polymerase I subunit D n=2 Tax=Neodiprion lecontei TaxID=441921 RepID=A0ABM3GHN8_NEOLC|nr:probable DNA-directed RNA polymerases I and III subunit RPAC2 isoform X1 [Neodiprion pinetum]XP_046599791.1 probable DNA-directed RNA polymerases I and III subunit RPAC2 isoform X1 [Neodiprion lecontei]